MSTARTTDPPVDLADLAVEALGVDHWPAVREIYAEGLATGHASFETEPPSWDDFRAGHLPDHQLVAHDEREVLGWAALSPVSDRCAYQGVAEDRGRILSLTAQHAGPAGSWSGLVRTEDTTPLEPGLVENKYYARGVGVVHEETLAGGKEQVELVSFRR